MRNIFHATVFLCLMLASSCANKSSSQSLNGRYPMPWREPNKKEFIALGKAIVNKGIKVCGEYYIRETMSVPGEYLVGCTADGKTWNYYVVNAVVSDVVGPIKDSTIVNPR